MEKPFDRKLILEDGSEFSGYSFGYKENKVTEIVFNTSMVGYQEIISDPSYKYQSVVMSYPLIGNYGINDDDFERDFLSVGGLIVKEYNDKPSNFRSKHTLSEIMEKNNVCGLYGVDTRKLVRLIRDFGSRRCLMTSPDVDAAEGVKIIRNTPVLTDAAGKVSRKKIEAFSAGGDVNIVAVDCGMKQNIVRSFLSRGVNVTAVPFDTGADKLNKLKPDGIFISNGPGNPEDAKAVIETVKEFLGKLPVFGICLGHQIIALSYGARTYKLKFGHRGGNHPVKDLTTGKIEITSQNHSFAVDKDSLGNTPLKITHINLLDNTIEGLSCEKDRVFSVQYHPESAPGPQDSSYLFDKFIQVIKENKNA